MKTQRIISNISYNTDQHFSNVIHDLNKRRVIDWCYWIRHKADKDELKDHIHFVLKPSSRIDTEDLRKALFELDPQNPSKPLTCTMKWNNTTSMADWLLYAVHDKTYLASKSQQRQYRYEYSDLHSTDHDALLEDWNSIDRTKFDRLRLLLEAVEENVPFAVLVQQGIVPIAQRAQYDHQYTALQNLSKTKQAGRQQSHENVDQDGVIIEP